MADWEFDTTNEGSEDDIAGLRWLLAGRYHVIVQAVDDSFAKYDKIIVTFQALAGTTPNQVGHTIREYFAVSDKAMDRLKRFAMATGLLLPREAKKRVDFRQAEGRQLVIEVEDHEYNDDAGNAKKGTRIGYLGMWSVGNPAVADVPKDEAALKLLPAQRVGTALAPAPGAASAYADI